MTALRSGFRAFSQCHDRDAVTFAVTHSGRIEENKQRRGFAGIVQVTPAHQPEPKGPSQSMVWAFFFACNDGVLPIEVIRKKVSVNHTSHD